MAPLLTTFINMQLHVLLIFFPVSRHTVYFISPCNCSCWRARWLRADQIGVAQPHPWPAAQQLPAEGHGGSWQRRLSSPHCMTCNCLYS
jgi:hypothetical protein